jgi:hypothetical protein
MGYTKLMDKKGIIAFLDFEKAFDTINWDVIYDALSNFNLGANFSEWVKTIYNDSEACVTNNGYSSPFFKLQRGVRQGCPLSAYLFIMVVEILAHKIRESNEIKGIKIGQTEIKLVQMADETTVFVEDPDSLKNIIKLLNIFEEYAGLKLNKTKTEAMWLGKNINNTNTEVLGLKWVKKVHSLGIFFSYDTDYVIQKNFTDKAKDFKRVLDMWLQRDLSLIGKILILKSLAFSKIIYQSGVMTVPPKFINQITSIAYDFIWNYKPDKIRRKTLISEYEKGGLKMLDIKEFLKAQKAMWVKRLLSPDNASWKAIPKLYLQNFLGTNTFKCNIGKIEKPQEYLDFYWQILQNWNELKQEINIESSAMDIRRECIWFNQEIKINNEYINWKDWQDKGVNIIHDIVDKEGVFISEQMLEQKYGIKSDTMRYNSIKVAIPVKWKRKLKTMNIPTNAVSFNETPHIFVGKHNKPIHLVTNKDIYWIFVNKISEEPIIIAKMQQELGIEANEWPEIFSMSLATRDTKLRAFQYKILYNLIPCNLYLHRIKKSNTNKCQECHMLDDIIHYLFECPNIKIFWKNFTKWWKDFTKENIIIDKRTAIIGIIGNAKKNKLINACILMAKWHIFKNKLNEAPIFFYKFLCDLKYYLMIEKTIATRNNNLEGYTNTWGKIEEQIT